MAKPTRSSKRRKPVDEDETPRRKRRTTKGSTVKIDLRDAESGGKRRFPEGDYKVKVSKAERTTSQNGTSQIKVTFEMLEPEKFEGQTLNDYLALTRKAAWRIGNLFDAVGIKWSQKVMEFNTGKLIGKELGITLTDNTWNGKITSKVADYLDTETIDGILSGEDIEDEEDASESEESEESEEGDEEEDLEEFDEDEDL